MTVLDPAAWIAPGQDSVAVDGREVGEKTERIAVALHKPVGLLTTRSDPGGRPTVYDALGTIGRWLFPVGRLDRDSSGLLLLTNDHRLGERLTAPAAHVPKTYHVLVAGVPDHQALRALREGLPLDDGPTRPARVRQLGVHKGGCWVEVVLTEGRNRQLRRMCAAVGHDVVELVRVAIGGLALAQLGLAPGESRRLLEREIALLTQGASVPTGQRP